MELLKQLYGIHSPSYGEKKMKKFIKGWCRYNIPEANVVAENGNLYITKGDAETYPCIVAHLDQVQDKHSDDFRCYVSDGKVYGFSVKEMRMEGLGADDKNGIWIALKCLLQYDVMKVAFFMGEEVGCVGSGKANMEFFEDCRWVVQCDRRDGGDLISMASCVDLCSQDFLDAIEMDRFGYHEEHGLMTDVMELKEQGLKVSCVNMSCGYHRPHTDGEYTVISELMNCRRFVEWIVENVTDVYPHEYADSYGAYGKYGKYDDYYDFDGWYHYKPATDDELANLIADYMWGWEEATDEEIYENVRYYTNRPKADVMTMIRACRNEMQVMHNAS